MSYKTLIVVFSPAHLLIKNIIIGNILISREIQRWHSVCNIPVKKGEHTMSPVREYILFGTASELEKELSSILFDSSLYREMYPEEKRKLLAYLVSSYFI